MGIETLFVDVILKAAAGQFGKKVADVVLSYPFVDRLKSLIPMGKRDVMDKFSRGEVGQEEVDMVRKHITSDANTTQEFKTLVKESFNLSEGDMQLFTQHLKALNDNIGKRQKLIDQHGKAGIATQGDYENMIDQAREKVAYHEEQALKLLTLRH